MSARAAGFDLTGIVLHWAVAAGIVGMVAFGMAIGAMESGPDKTRLIQVHKSFGILVGALALARLLRRARDGFPEPVGSMSRIEALAARHVHVALLVLTVLMPLSGILKSVTYARPVDVFGLPFLPQLLDEKHVALNEAVSWVHATCGWLLALIIVVHACGALKHHFVNRDATLRRMLRPAPQR
jgi:cytochrome b561